MPSRAETPWFTADRLWTVALVTLPALVVFLDGRWIAIPLMALGGPSWPLQVAVGAVAATGLARLALSGGAVVAVAALVAGQVLVASPHEEADLAAFLVAAFQVALAIFAVEALRGGWRGAPSASWAPERVREQALTYGLLVGVGLLAWWSGSAAWLFGHFGAQDSGVVPDLVAFVVAGRAALLLHELGHALAARRRLRSEVALRVGRRGTPLTFEVGGVRTRLHLLDVAGETGAVEADASHGSADDMAWIALAGPAASLAGLAAALLPLTATSTEAGLWHSLFWWFAIANLIGVLNLLPFRFQPDRGSPPVPSDGRQLADALAVKWALR